MKNKPPPSLPEGRRCHPDGFSLPLGGAGGGLALHLSRYHVLVERSAHSTKVGIEFLHHTFDLFAKSCFIEVNGEDILATVKLTQATEILVWFTDFQRSHDGLQLFEQWVWRWFESFAIVLYALQITCIASERDGISTRLLLSSPRAKYFLMVSPKRIGSF